MPLILAVEPDRRQAAHLTHIVRQRVGAELVLAETTELALAQIGNRVPDLILVPALMSPTDDAALAAALRVIASAAHVQMLTTPLFASAPPEPKARGVLAAFRRAKPTKPATDGCDPAEFAQQISSYLQSAAEERATAQYIEPPLPVRTSAPSPVVETPQRYVPLEPGRLYRDEAAPSSHAFDTPSVEAIPEPGLELPNAEPVAESVEPIAGFETEQVPVYEPPYVEPYVERIYQPADTLPEPVLATESFLETPELVLDTAEPVLETPELVLDTPEPVLDTPELVLDTSQPVLDTTEPVLDTPEPVFETPEPLAAQGPAQPRRIGFVVHDEEQEVAPLVAESVDIEFEPIELDASADTPFVIEAIAEQEPEAVAAAFASSDDEAIELVDVDLSGDFSEFNDLQVVQAQSDDDVVEILETPDTVDATAPAAAHVRVIEADALKDFAAAVEAMTASEHMTAAAREAASAESLEFDDLFPPRQAVEPSPLNTWRSWARLEGIDAEAWEAPVSAQVVERAVERAPERPDWVQLIESLRIDVERRRSENTSSAAPKAARKAPTRPVQDEWGLFDPTQCGFAALLAKLDEITDANESRPRRSA